MPAQPNILFIFTDQQSRSAISAYGNPHLHTHHMDSIAANGVRFELAYCTSPVFGPSRSSLLTGCMPHETGVNVNMKKENQVSRPWAKSLVTPATPPLGLGHGEDLTATYPGSRI